MSCTRLICWALLVALAVGCSKKETPPPPGADVSARMTPPEVTAPGKTPAMSGPTNGPTEMVAQAPGKTAPAGEAPDEVARQFFNALANNQPQVVWDDMPASYQADIKKLIVDFAEKMDPELWDTGFDIAQKLVKVLKTKRELLKQNPLVAQMLMSVPVPPEELDKHWEEILMLPETLVNSDLSSHANLKQADVSKFLKGTIAELMTKATAMSEIMPGQAGQGMKQIESLKDVKITLVKQDGDTATIHVEKPGEEPKDVELVKVEGKWVPKEMADKWQAKLAEAREGIEKMSKEQIATTREQMMPMLKQVDKSLDEMLAASTPEEFNAAVGGLLGTLAPFMPGAGGPGGPPGGPDAPDGVPPTELPVTPPSN